MNRKNKYKDLEKWRKSCEKQRKRYYAKTTDAVNKNKPYSEREIELILQHDITDTQLSKMIGRSVKAIQVKRAKLNKEEK